MRLDRRLSCIPLFVALILWGSGGCRKETDTALQRRETSKETKAMSMEIKTTAFADDEKIPTQFTGDGEDVSPILSWSGVPNSAKELALICDDPDAPRPEPWVHWVIYKLPATTTGLPEGMKRAETLTEPAGAVQGKNSWGTIGYRGPAPPPGHGVHHYHFRLYALDTALDVGGGLDKDQLLAAMTGHVIAQAEMVGTYER
jgi:Raf kinase inhibitor-like YbhB/YbcL family protein